MSCISCEQCCISRSTHRNHFYCQVWQFSGRKSVTPHSPNSERNWQGFRAHSALAADARINTTVQSQRMAAVSCGRASEFGRRSRAAALLCLPRQGLGSSWFALGCLTIPKKWRFSEWRKRQHWLLMAVPLGEPRHCRCVANRDAAQHGSGTKPSCLRVASRGLLSTPVQPNNLVHPLGSDVFFLGHLRK